MSLLRQNIGLTASEAKELVRNGFILKFITLGAGDKDFYDIYVVTGK